MVGLKLVPSVSNDDGVSFFVRDYALHKAANW